MITIISALFLICIIYIAFKSLPAIIGFSFTIFVAMLQVIGFLFLLPILGILFLLVDILVIGTIVGLIKILF